MGEKCEIMRAKNPECSRRQVGDKGEIRWATAQSVFCRKTSPETNAKSCGPSMRPFQRSKNPSQVNLFGEPLQSTCMGLQKASEKPDEPGGLEAARLTFWPCFPSTACLQGANLRDVVKKLQFQGA